MRVKVFVYVEGPADVLALRALFETYRGKLKQSGHALSFHPLKNKSQFLRKVGARSAEKLMANDKDRVVALPDLYPNQDYADTQYTHADFQELRACLRRLVKRALTERPYNVPRVRVEERLSRFYPCALKHDLEMLILAAWPCLKEHIGAPNNASGWRHPVEEQNQNHPPKRVVERLFMSKTKRAYRDTLDAPGVLRRVDRIDDLLCTPHGQPECPVFKGFLDWLRDQTGVPAY